MTRELTAPAADLNDAAVALGRPAGDAAHPRLQPQPLLEALARAGTSHVYADTADVDELGGLVTAGDDAVLAQIDGNTANQPLVRKVAVRYLDAGEPAAWAQQLREGDARLDDDAIVPLLYAIVCGRVGNEIVRRFAAGRDWEVSLQLHMGLSSAPEFARHVGRLLRAMVPTAFVKVPFAPHAPHCFLVARDLEREGIPVNFTSTFSARQAVAAALLADVSRTNIFMGRLNQGLEADLLGEHVDLEAQRALRRLRRDAGVKTQLIVASMREWETFPRTAGCDVYTAPVGVIRDFLAQSDVWPPEIESRLETSYEDRLGVPGEVRRRAGDGVARLYRVEPELIEFLTEFRDSDEYAKMSDGDALHARFDRAGFGDLFFAPAEAQWSELRKDKLPDLDGDLVKRVALDTLFTLHAHADFVNHQDAIDREITARL